MEVSQQLSSILEEICLKVFPGSLVEIRKILGVCLWPYIIDHNCKEINDKMIATALHKYAAETKCSMEEHRAIAATKGALYGFLLLEDVCQKLFPNSMVKVKKAGIGLWPIVILHGKEISFDQVAFHLEAYLSNPKCANEEKMAIEMAKPCIESLLLV